MTLHLCIDCTTIWECPPNVALICPRCEQPLIVREEPDGAATFSEVCLMAMHGIPLRLEPVWSIE